MAENKFDDTVKVSNSASIINNFLTKAGKKLVLIIALELEHKWGYNTVLFKMQF